MSTSSNMHQINRIINYIFHFVFDYLDAACQLVVHQMNRTVNYRFCVVFDYLDAAYQLVVICTK